MRMRSEIGLLLYIICSIVSAGFDSSGLSSSSKCFHTSDKFFVTINKQASLRSSLSSDCILVQVFLLSIRFKIAVYILNAVRRVSGLNYS